MKEDLSKAIFLLDNITRNMEWIKLLLEKDRVIAPLKTYDFVIERLEQVEEIVKSNLGDDFTGENPFYRDSVGTEELN